MGHSAIFNFFNNIESHICRTLLATFVLLLFAQIISREFFQYSIAWSEELATYMFVWFVFFGASYAAKLAAHNRVTFQFKFLPRRTVYWIEAFADLIWLCFNLYFVWLSTTFILSMNKFVKSQTLGLHMSWFYWVLPIAFALMSVRIVQVNYYRLFKGIDIRDPEELEREKIMRAGDDG